MTSRRAPASSADGQHDRLAGALAQPVQRVRTGDELVALAVDGKDRVARLEPRHGGRRVGLDLVEPDADERRREPGDPGEDDERERRRSSPRRRPGSISFLRQPLRGERARIVGVVAVLAFELDEPADRQPVERVERPARWPGLEQRLVRVGVDAGPCLGGREICLVTGDVIGLGAARRRGPWPAAGSRSRTRGPGRRPGGRSRSGRARG